jgi:hypothetical protein
MVFRTYVKILGPPIIGPIKELEKIAIKKDNICIMDFALINQLSSAQAADIGGSVGPLTSTQWVNPSTPMITMKYFERSGIPITIERCKNIISRSGESLGDNDFFFEWLKKPSFEEMNRLIEEMDEALAPYHCLYTIYNK